MPNFSFKDFTDEINNTEPIEEVALDVDKVKENVVSFSNEKLCEMIVCDRYFGFANKVSAICIEELGKRRLAGDTFNFEQHINTITKELPVLDFKLPDFAGVIKQVLASIKR